MENQAQVQFSSRHSLAVRAFLKNENGEVLLLQRSLRSATNAGRWELPGGKVDAGERFDDALHREILEETGLEIALGGPLGCVEQHIPKVRAIHLIMEGMVIGGALHVSDEHITYAWVTPARFADFELADWFEAFVERNGSMIGEPTHEGPL